MAAVVSRSLSNLDRIPWELSPWNKAGGGFASDDDVPPGVSAAGTIRISVDYSGNGFEHFNVHPVKGLVPGSCRKVSLWAKGGGEGFSWALSFRDAEGRDTVDGKKLSANIDQVIGEWTKTEFSIPEAWIQPITIGGITAHNWSKQKEEADLSLLISDFVVETDVSAISNANDLLSVQVETGSERNIFTDDVSVSYRLALDSWAGGETAGKLTYWVKTTSGGTVVREEREIQFKDAAAETIEFTPKRYGVYSMRIALALDTGDEFKEESRFLYIPAPHKYTPEEKMASPYGINIHGGIPGVAYKELARLGYAWIRDYAYKLEWITRAKGEDGKYGGWPWYPKMDKLIQEAGLMLLPCFMGWIGDGVANGDLAPTKQFKIDILQYMMAFPQYVAWEADNEYDLHKRKDEEERNWSSYRAYHRTFGETVAFLDDDALAVEQGCAGVHPERTRRNIESGSFDNIDVINAHFYCGTTAPELSLRNANTGGDREDTLLVYDNLRELAEAADSDGKDRQVWITEFGWDTLAGHVVTEHEQAAYLQRGYLLGLQAGIDKMFWYWNRDTKKKPSHFFDGCGIFDPKDEPKPVSAAMAALVHFLKLPEKVGTFDMGPNTFGHVLKDRGRLVACVFKLDKEKPGPTLMIKERRLFDMYGNIITEPAVELGVAPVWIRGIRRRDPICLATAYDLASRHFDKVAAGDTYTIKLRATHNRGGGPMPITSLFRVESPDGCEVDPSMREIFVASGSTEIIPITVAIGPSEPAGRKTITVTVQEGKNTKRLTTDLQVVPAAGLKVRSLAGEPGLAKLSAKIRNNSSITRDFVIAAEAPSGWSIGPGEVTVTNLAALAEGAIEFDVNWNTAWGSNEQANLIVKTPEGRVIVKKGIIPPVLPIPLVDRIAFDGKLGDWPDAARIPDWTIGDSEHGCSVDIYTGYSPEGLLFAFRIAGASARVTDPKWFWEQDCVEIFIDSQNDKTSRKAYRKTDHQFWFCPMVEENRVYAGRWKRNDEIEEIRYDLDGINGFAGKTDAGYVMEFLLPSSRIADFSPEKGKELGAAIVVTVPQEGGKREIFWPREKDWDTQTRPNLWGTIALE